MNDIIGRVINENDLVLGMTIGRHSDGIRFGVYNGTSVNWRCGTVSTCCNMYLIENPSAKEAEIKQSIIDKVKESKERDEAAKAKRKELRRIPAKDLVVGGSYVDDKGCKYVYLGKGSVYDGYEGKTSVGYIYLSMYDDNWNSETGKFRSIPWCNVLKNPKKLVAVVDKITSYPFDKQEFTMEESGHRMYGRQCSLKFTLEAVSH